MTVPAAGTASADTSSPDTQRVSTQVLVAVISGVFQLLVAFVALFGTLATASDRGSAQPAGGTSPPGASCTSVYREYRGMVRQDPVLVIALTTAGADRVSPVDVDPDARRCGIDGDVLRVMRRAREDFAG
jgi:hypothetical protein